MLTAKSWVGLNPCGNTLAFVYTGPMFSRAIGNGRLGGVVMAGPMRLIGVVMVLSAFAQPVMAFQESGGSDKTPEAAAPAVEMPKSAPAAAAPGKGLSLKAPELSIGQGTGTEVRIPGFGSVGVLPKLDFGLELLYGATDSRSRPDDRSEPSDVQIRGTIKHRF